MPAILTMILSMLGGMGASAAAPRLLAMLGGKLGQNALTKGAMGAASGLAGRMGAANILPKIPIVAPRGLTAGTVGQHVGTMAAFTGGMLGTEHLLGGGDNYEQMDAIESQPYRGDMGLARQEGVMGKVAEEAALKNALQSMFGVDNMDDLMLLMQQQQQQGAGGLI